jgi:UDP-N-acetylmuramoyl-tripeptide--D-alanyl-D-alanine ligase
VTVFTIAEVASITNGRVRIRRPQDLQRAVRRVWTDSRTCRAGDLFVALVGPRFDGHRYLRDARRKGAIAALVQKGSATMDGAPVVQVDDTLRAFQQLAAAHRRRFAIPVVAVSGSNGKTTTKEMIGRILSERFRTLVTAGNYNNHIGVPQTLFQLTRRHDAAVIEMGISGLGEMTRLCEIAAPTHGVLTNIGPTHLATLGTLDTVARAKGELLKSLPSDGTAILNADDPYYRQLSSWANGPVLSFGFSRAANVRALKIRSKGPSASVVSVRLPRRRYGFNVRLQVAGRHNIANALAAVATGTALGVGVKRIQAGLARYKPGAMRSEVQRRRGVMILNDCYNANPASVRVALDWLAEIKGTGRSFAVLGEMRELGEAEVEIHREVGRALATRADYLLTTGRLGSELAAGAIQGGMRRDHVVVATDQDELAKRLRTLLRKGDSVLLKGSRAAKMERVLEKL